MYTDNKSRAAAIVGYLFVWIGVIVAFILRDKDDELSRHHLNQAIVLATAECIASLMIKLRGVFAVVGEVADVAHVSRAIQKAFNPDRINYGAYNDTGIHLHYHLVPKYEGEFEWGDVFAMNPGRVTLSDEEYAAMIEKIKAVL